MKLLTLFLLASSLLQAKELDFESLWQELQINSDKLKSAKAQVELSRLEEQRAQRHWIPRVMVGARTFQTNDPSAVLFNKLGQGNVAQSDFAPTTLNDPGTKKFTNIGLTVDLPLYEGGAKSQLAKMKHSSYLAQQQNQNAHISDSYAQLLSEYVELVSSEKNIKEFLKLNKSVDDLLKSYKLGTKKNPIGYSGLLGFKSVHKRIKAYLNHLHAHTKAQYNLISFKTGLSDFKIRQENDFVNFLSQKVERNKMDSSSKLRAFSMEVASIQNLKDIEKARYLPQVGLFSNTNIYEGAGSPNTAQSAGIYLKWDLFNNDSYGRVAEAKQKARLHERSYEYSRDQEEAAKKSIMFGISALTSNYKLLGESLELLNEQIRVSLDLFKKGKINGIQIAEILNRKVDLIVQKMEIEHGLIKNYAMAYKLTH